MSGETGKRLPLVRLALALYPPAWRDRYGDEVLALLAQSGGGTRAAASLAWHAVPAWICPPRSLFPDRAARMRASLATVLLAWSVLIVLCLAFVQLTQLRPAAQAPYYVVTSGSRVLYIGSAAYPDIVRLSYQVFDAALALSALAIAVGSLPLWLVMLRRARRRHSRRDLTRLLLPLLAPACYAFAAVAALRLIHRPVGLSVGWFLGFLVAGLAAAIMAALGPARAMRSMKLRGPAVSFAIRAALVGMAGMLVAVVASSTAGVTLYLYMRYLSTQGMIARAHLVYVMPRMALHATGQQFAQEFDHQYQYPSTAMLVVYVALVTVATMVAIVGASRGARAALTRSDPRIVQP
jgi:hypothetical protein